MEVSCKHMNPEQRLYNLVKSQFVERADPLLLRFYIDLTTADEERILQETNRVERASLLLRLLVKQPGGFNQLIKALRNPQVDQGDLADFIEQQRASVLAVVNIHVDGDVDMTDEEEEEAMDVDDVVDADASIPPPPVSQPGTALENIGRQLVDTSTRNLLNNKDLVKSIGELLMQMGGVLLAGAQYGCLELLLQVKSLSALYRLKKLYQGRALCDALSRVILTQEFKQEVHQEAAKQGYKVKNLRLSVKISQNDFLECQHFLASIDIPPPIGYLEVMSEPVDPFGEPNYPTLQDHLKSLPTMYQQFIKSVAEVTDNPSQKSALTLAKLPVYEMVKESMDRLHKCFKIEHDIKQDMVEVGLRILCKSAIYKRRNVNVVTFNTEDDIFVQTDVEMNFRMSISDFAMSVPPSSIVKRLVDKGWLKKINQDSDGRNVKYAFPGALKRDYVLCYILPTVLEHLDISLFLDRDGADKSSDHWWFPFASIILPYVACYEGLAEQFPPAALYFPNVALFLSSLHASVDKGEVKKNLEILMKQFHFQSFLKFQTSSDVDRHWKTWKAVAANLGCDQIMMVSKSDVDEASFNNQISVIEDSLKIGHGNIIALEQKYETSDLRLALRSVALLDLLPSVMVDTVPQVELKRSESTASGTTESTSKESPTASTSKESPTTSGTGTASGGFAVASSQTSDPFLEGAAKSDEVEMRLSRSHSHDTSQRFSGSDVEVELLQKEGRLTLDAKKIRGDYRLRKASDWGFTLDLSQCDLTEQHVYLLCRFLPQLNHVTSFRFGGSSLDNAMVKRIVRFLNPDTVKELSFVGCPINFLAGKIGFEKFRKLEFLDLEDTGIEDMSCPPVIEEIEHLNNLKELNIGCNTVSSHGFTMISSALVSKFNLRALRLHSNLLGAEGASVLAQLIFSLRHLEILSLWGCGLGDEGIGIVSEMFSVHQKLKRLSIRDNNTSSKGSDILYRNLASCPDLQFIDYNESLNLASQNEIQVSENLLSMFKASSSWDHISLWDCNIGQLTVFKDPADFTSLANVTYVCLQKNCLTDDSLIPLAQCIEKHFSYLQHLNLRENMLGDQGAAALARGLVGKTHLEDLWLDWNMFGHSGAKALIGTIEGLPKLQSADLSYSYQLSPPERDDLVRLIGDPIRDGNLLRAQKDQLTFTI